PPPPSQAALPAARGGLPPPALPPPGPRGLPRRPRRRETGLPRPRRNPRRRPRQPPAGAGSGTALGDADGRARPHDAAAADAAALPRPADGRRRGDDGRGYPRRDRPLAGRRAVRALAPHA